VRAMVFANRAMASRGHLNEQARRWLDEAGTTPPGNGVERELWEARQALGQRPWQAGASDWTMPPPRRPALPYCKSLGGLPSFGCRP